MKLNSITPFKLHNTFILVTAISILIFSNSIAQAENWGVVTIQSTHGYGSTIPIHHGTIDYLQKNAKSGNVYVADDHDNSRVSSVLNNLRDSDVLIINTHSNAKVFGVGRDAVSWTQFYGYWNIRKPPKPALVIVHGCIFDRDSDGNTVPATDRQIQEIRRSLNAKAIISFNTKINALAGRISLHQLMVGILKERKIASLIKSPNLRFLVDSNIDRENVTLADLKTRSPASNDLVGSWVGCDKRVVTFTLENGEYIGRYTKLGGLGAYHFQVNEIGYKAKLNLEGKYVGQVKWRWTSGEMKWHPNTITINGNKYTDSGSDSCSRRMVRR